MPQNRIDVHAHYLGGAVVDLFRSGFSLAGGYRIDVRWSPAEAIAYMDRHGIATQLLSTPWTFTGTEQDPGFATKFARRVNEEYAAVIDEHPGRFGAFAAVPGDSPEAMLTEIEYALDTLHLDGVLLNSNTEGEYFGMPFFEPVLAELDRRRVPVLVHPNDSAQIRELGFGRPSSVVEYTFDTARAITNALYRGVFRRYPDLRLILAHCGGALPTLGWRIAEHTTMGIGPDDSPIDPAHVAEVLRGLYYDTALAGSRNSLLPTLEVTGADHLLFGTDWPAAPEPTVVRNIDNLSAFGFTGPQLVGIEHDNAAPLFPRFA
ncbi:amidohydrolase family protein [Micromonosporaceae bacterium Da 78-11]